MAQESTTVDLQRTSVVGQESPLYRFEAKLTVVPIGLVPEGIRMANAFEGHVTSGIMEGARVWGIDHLLLRQDGVAVIDAQKTISNGDTHLYERLSGYGLPPHGMGMPPLDVLLDPAFEWPDVLFPILGVSMFRAAAPELQYLNREIARVDGWFSFATGGLAVETRLIRHVTDVAAPAREHRDLMPALA